MKYEFKLKGDVNIKKVTRFCAKITQALMPMIDILKKQESSVSPLKIVVVPPVTPKDNDNPEI